MTFIIMYIAGLIYYQGRFLPNTYAGSVDISGKNVAQAEEHVNQELAHYPISLNENGEDYGYIELGQLNITLQDESPLQDVMEKQLSWLWPAALFQTQQIELTPYLDQDDSLTQGLINAIGINNDERVAAQNAYLQETESGQFEVREEVYGEQITTTSLSTTLKEMFDQNENDLALEMAYVKPEITKDSPQLDEQKEYINNMRQTKIVHTFDGKEVVVPQELIAEWVYVDENGEPQVDTDSIESYLGDVNAQHAGLFQPFKFYSTYQGLVEVPPGTLGWYIDRFTESEQMAQTIFETGEHYYEPIIDGYGYGYDQHIGNSYVEVDLTHQMMLIYIDGELVLDTPIVSGHQHALTIPGAYQVWQKLTDTDLTGYDPINEREYVQPVDYWIAFDDQAQGIHDAKWQGSFGGNNYLNAGSLGCINTPPTVMSTVFELVPIGMPVMVF